MIDKFSSISTRKLPKAMSVLTRKSMVAISDYGDYQKMAKRNIMIGMLGFNAQVQISAKFKFNSSFRVLIALS